jgi:DNA mismatch repair protein MLH3
VIWTDPNTNESFIVDMATGNSYPMDRSRAVRAQGSQSSKAHYPPVAKRCTISAPSYRLSAEGATADHSTPDWIQRALQENTVYTTTQRPIRQERLDRPAAGSSSGWPPTHSEAHAFQSITLSQLDPTRDLGSDALRDARVINQVDDKFIACVLTCNPSNMEALPRSQTSGQGQGKKLVLIDQHAADERVRVEQLLMGPCRDFLEGHSSSIRYLDPPKPILLAAKEAERLRASEEIQEALARWSFTFHSLDEETPLDEYQDHTQMLVQTIPSVIADKVRGYSGIPPMTC